MLYCPDIPVPKCVPKSALSGGEEGIAQWLRATAVKERLEQSSPTFWFSKDVHRWLHLLLIANSDIARIAISLGWVPSTGYLKTKSQFILTDTPDGFIFRIKPLSKQGRPPVVNPYLGKSIEENTQLMEQSFGVNSRITWDERKDCVFAIQAALDLLAEDEVQQIFLDVWSRLWLAQNPKLPSFYSAKDTESRGFKWPVARLRRNLFDGQELIAVKGNYCGFACSDFQALPYNQIQRARFFCLKPKFNLVTLKHLNAKLSTYFKLDANT